MKYVITTYDYGRPMFFTEHKGAGFTISNNQDKAKTYGTKGEAEKEAKRLAIASGTETVVKPRSKI